MFSGIPAYALEAEITTAPEVPAFITRTMPETVEVHFETKEFVGDLADGKRYKFWSFNGTVPGPMIRVRLGDTVEFHLSNHSSSKFPHNIDLHAVNGPGGGASVSLVAPGEERVFRFKTLHPGLYVYHCASPIPSIPAHIANGMYGLLLVEPKHGFSRVDHEFYVFESEFFTQTSDEEDLSAPRLKPVEPKKKQGKIEVDSEENASGASVEKEKKDEGFMDSLVNIFSEKPANSLRIFQTTVPKAKIPDVIGPSGKVIRDIIDKTGALIDYDGDGVFSISSSDEKAAAKAIEYIQNLVQEDEPLNFPEPEKKYLLELSLEKGSKEQPDYVVFNGRQGALLGENALEVNVGEKVRIFFGNIGPNGISSFRVIGEIFDRVYLEGSVNGIVNRNVQTTLVPSAGATIVEFTIDVPGDYLLVDHSIFRIDKGAIGMITAVGDNRPKVFESIK
ncbi:multicopper oxidase domain-containing protein [Nitrospinae bacterium]|nr:multicopper oxidase domain-containing protein [Nitrospinota bacterium]